ncbi:hypothetical protein H6778_02520 [Candidatus Nomurabacteria bacterium]|nr:hypothetical protein [Candidatus Nomurabacteria bacterium]
MLTPATAERIVQDILHQKFGFFPVDRTLVDEVSGQWLAFVQRRIKTGDAADWLFTNEGEEESDVGLVVKSGETHQYGQYDHKLLFQNSVRLRRQLARKDLAAADWVFLAQHRVLMEHVQRVELRLLEELERLTGESGIVGSVIRSALKPIPYAMSTLRALVYQAVAGQKGAQKHLDRGFLTLHSGDVNGRLVYFDGPDDDSPKPIDVPSGYGVAFPGIKWLWVFAGKYQPLWHGAEVTSDGERVAHPYFSHVELCGYMVRDFRAALQDFHSTFLPLMQQGQYHWRMA